METQINYAVKIGKILNVLFFLINRIPRVSASGYRGNRGDVKRDMC